MNKIKNALIIALGGVIVYLWFFRTPQVVEKFSPLKISYFEAKVLENKADSIELELPPLKVKADNSKAKIKALNDSIARLKELVRLNKEQRDTVLILASQDSLIGSLELRVLETDYLNGNLESQLDKVYKSNAFLRQSGNILKGELAKSEVNTAQAIDKLDKSEKKAKRRGAIVKALGAVVIFETIIIILNK